MEVITFSAPKGGVGKTTLAYNFGCWLADTKHKKVLFCDLDQQCSLSRVLGVTDQKNSVAGIFDGTSNTKVQEIAPNIDLLSGATDLDLIQTRLETKSNKLLLLYLWLIRNKEIVLGHDYMVIDTPPVISTITQNALVISDVIYLPATPSKFSFDSIPEAQERFDELKDEAINTMTGETLVKAKLCYIGNEIRNNTAVSRSFAQLIQKQRKDGQPWIATFPLWEPINRSIFYAAPISQMAKAADNDADIKMPASVQQYAKRQKNDTYKLINQQFEQMMKKA